jgi:sulfite exporter TauE/SafE
VNLALITSASLLGLAGAPHCAAMCGAPCAAAVAGAGRPGQAVFLMARLIGYAAGGAVAAGSVSALADWSAVSPALRPLWALLNAGALVLGCWLLLRGRQPAWMARLGRGPALRLAAPAAGWVPVRVLARTSGVGLLWVAWPCGLLQSALLVAALTNGVAEGALAMAGFALASAPGLIVGPWLWQRWVAGGAAAVREAWAARAAGLLLTLASAWALAHQVAPGFAAYCRSLW